MRKPSATNPTIALADQENSVQPPNPRSPTFARDFRSFVRNTLLASPSFTRLYADVLASEGYKPNEAMILAERYKKKSGVPMPAQPNVRTCTHIMVTGVRCGSPALRGERFCYFHQRMIRGVNTPPNSRVHPIAFLENEESIQASLMEMVNALLRGTIDIKRGELVLRALNAAARNCRRARFKNLRDMVREVPDYPAPPNPEPPAAPAEPCPQKKPPASVPLPQASQERKRG